LSWTENDVNALIGQSESIRREFKSGRMFDGSQESQWIQKLAVEVSAFANTEGGDLLLGIDEDRKSKPRVAISVDGSPLHSSQSVFNNLLKEMSVLTCQEYA
jgi:predicted HTH transcriptional regulator